MHLDAEPFRYQETGAEWLHRRARAYLADEQGLGKSCQAIIAADAAGARHVCVVCPASVVENWKREIEMWSLGLWSYVVLSYDKAVRYGLPEADTFIVDEAHFLKSPTAKRTRTLLSRGSPLHRAARVWALSGTPAPNHAGELYTWLAFMGAIEQRTHLSFLEAYVNFSRTDWGVKVWGNKRQALPQLQAIKDTVMLRRMKADVLRDLPPIRWGDIRLAANVGSCETAVDYLLNIGDDLPTEDEHLAALRRQVGEAKAPALAAFLADELEGSQEKIVVFAWHRAVMDTLHETLGRFGVARIDGGTPSGARQQEVDRFQGDQSCRVFLGQIIAAGTGITLTAASSLVFAEMAWTPGDNAQAAMRVHRIGQTQPVLIRTATLSDSIDEAVNAVLVRKTRGLDQLYEREAA